MDEIIENEPLIIIDNSDEENIETLDLTHPYLKYKELAGILYLDMPKGAPVTSYLQPWNNIKTDTTIYYPIPVTEGHMIVLPQMVQHFSPPNIAKKKKRIISWDMSILPDA